MSTHVLTAQSRRKGNMQALVLKRLLRSTLYITLAVIAFIWIVPFVWMLKTSISPGVGIFSPELDLVPKALTSDNFAQVFRLVPVARLGLNSTIISVGTTAVVIIVSSLAGYALSRPGMPFATPILFFFLAAIMIPGEAVLIPTFIAVRDFGLLNSYWGIILPMATDAFVIYIFERFFSQIPQEIVDAATVDGASDLDIFLRIVVPMSTPVLAAMTTLVFIGAYDAFLWPLVVVNDRTMMPLTLGLFYFETEQIRNYEYVIAYSALLTAPILIIFLAGQKFFIKGLQLGALKG